MSVSSLTSLLECLEIIQSSPNKFGLNLFEERRLNVLKENGTLLINIIKGLEPIFDNDVRMKIEKENIGAIASKVEYSFRVEYMADLPHNEINARLRAIAIKINFIINLDDNTLVLAYKSEYGLQPLQASWIADYIPYNKIYKRLLEIDFMIENLLRSFGQEFFNLEEQICEDGNLSQVAADYDGNFLSVGLEESLMQLRLQLTGSSRKLETVGIVGMAGIGKTTLARMIFQDPFIIQHFDIRAWVKVSQSHSKTDLLLQLLKCINQQMNDDIHGLTEACLEEDLYRSLKGQRYLIAVDDLWSDRAWNEMRRPFSDDSLGSRILFTSRDGNVFKDLNCKKIHRMTLLDEHTSWDLLQKKVFLQDACPPSLIGIGKQISKKCQGLPLAIVVIGGILLKISKKLESWKAIAESINSLVLSGTTPCQEMFALSYKHLPAHLKSCFLYMGAFPGGGFEIESQALSRLWIAEGFVVPMDTENLEQVAGGYLNDLIDRSLVLASSKKSNGDVKTCRLHDLLLDFCVNQARQDMFLDVIKDSREEEYLGGEEEIITCEKEEDIDQVPTKKLSEEKNRSPSRFSFHCNTFEDIPPKSKARTALFTVCSREVPDILLYYLELKSLVVLDMIPLRFDSFPEEQVSKLFSLKYLALTVSFELPSVVFRLSRLQTLIVNDSRIRTDTIAGSALPLEFWGSRNLRHMQLQVANYLPPPEDELSVEKMVFLRTLSKVTLCSCFTHESLARIPNVTKLGVCETMEDFRAKYLWLKFFENLVLLSQLETLKVYCLQMNNCSPRPLPVPGPNAFPKSLRKLTLSRSHLPWEQMKIMGKLHNLEVLKLRNYAFQGLEWETQGGGFQRLRYLLIENSDLKHWSLECDDCFPRLQQLVLKFCHSLEAIDEQIGDIPTLTCIELHFCSITAEQSVKYIQEQQDEYGHDIKVHIQGKTGRSTEELEHYG